MDAINNIAADFLVIDANNIVLIKPADVGLYGRLYEHYAGFTSCQLVLCYEFDADWASWDVHPADFK